MLRTKALVLSFFFMVVFSFGCTATIGYLNEGVPAYGATASSQVKIYSARDLDREVIEIGYVASHNTQQPTGDFMKEQIRKKAAAMGADAVVAFRLWGNMAEGIAVKFK